jgi:hypothetical protein
MADIFDEIFEGTSEAGGKKPEEAGVEQKPEVTGQSGVEQAASPETTGTPQQQTPATEENVEDFNVGEFNKKFNLEKWGLNFEKKEDIDGFFENSVSNSKKVNNLEGEIQDYKTKIKSFEEENQYYKDYVDKFSVESIFGSKENAEKYMLSKQLGNGRDPGVTEKIISTDVNSLNDLDALVLRIQYNTPKLAGQDLNIKRSVLKKIGVDVDEEGFDINSPQLDYDQQVEIAMQAGDARQYLNGLKTSAEKPELFSPPEEIKNRIEGDKAKKDSLVKSWDENADRVVEKIPDINLKFDDLDFTYNVDGDFKKSIAKDIKESAVKRGLEVNEDNIGKLAQEALERYEFVNRHKILKKAIEEERARLTEKYDDKINNTAPINDKESPNETKDSLTEMNNEISDYFKF